MALTAVPGGVWFPGLNIQGTAAFAADMTIDAAGDRAAVVFTLPTDGAIDKVLFRVGALTTGVTLDVRLETVSATTGAPSGSLWSANTSGQQTSPTANTTYEVTLTAAATVAIGDVIAVVIQPNTTPVNLGISRNDSALYGFALFGPYPQLNTTGSYGTSSAVPVIGLHLSGGTWVNPGFLPLIADSFPTNAFNTGTGASTGTARGMRFASSVAARIAGAWWRGNVAGDYTMVLYSDAGSTLLTSQTIDKDQLAGTGVRFVPFTGTYDLVGGTFYRLVVVPTSASSCTLHSLAVTSADHLDAHQGGQNVHECAFISSAWSNLTTLRPWMGAWLTHLDDGVSTGGQNRAILPSGVSALG